MTGFRLLPEAEADLDAIVQLIGHQSGPERAARVYDELLRAVRNVAAYPQIGHERTDLTLREIRVWTVFAYLIVYRRGTDPVEIVGFLHGSLDPSELRERIGEPVAQYVTAGVSSFDVELDARERQYLEARVRYGDGTSVADVLREAVRYAIDPAAEERRAYEAWREDARRKIDEAWDESAGEEGLDGAAVLEELRLALEERIKHAR